MTVSGSEFRICIPLPLNASWGCVGMAVSSFPACRIRRCLWHITRLTALPVSYMKPPTCVSTSTSWHGQHTWEVKSLLSVLFFFHLPFINYAPHLCYTRNICQLLWCRKMTMAVTGVEVSHLQHRGRAHHISRRSQAGAISCQILLARLCQVDQHHVLSWFIFQSDHDVTVG